MPGLFFTFLIEACSFSSKATKRLLNKSLAKTYDVIIVPGTPFENLLWGRTMKGRVYWSKYLYDRGITKNIMYSGSSVYTPYYEAIIMTQYGEAIGIPKKHIFTETKAEHSTENIFYSFKRAKQLGFEKIAVASDPFQTRLLRRYIRKRVSMDIDLIPFVVDTIRIIEPSMVDPVIDYQQAFNKEFISLKQRQSFWRRLRGTRGLNVDTTLYR
ncbi:MAG: YdcF family protein [Chitinophagaceae bacterium]